MTNSTSRLARPAWGAGSPDAAEFGDRLDHLFHREALKLAEQSAGIGVWSIDLTTGLVRGTAQFFQIMGVEPASGEVPVDTLRALRHPEDGARVLAGFRQALEDGTDAYEIEYRIVRPDGNVRWIFGRGRVVRDAHGTPIRYSGVDLDITDRKASEAALAAAKEELERMNTVLEARVRERTAALEAESERRMQAEARLHQAQKMEAVGQLTGGLAHDFNNILQIISGNLDIATRLLAKVTGDAQDPKRRGQLSAALATAQRASQSAKQLVLRMLAFSRLQNLQPALLDVNGLVTDMREMIQRTLGETVAVRLACAPHLWTACVDHNQLETALLNLVVNARDAMPHGGEVTIETANVEIGAHDGDDIGPGQYVMLAVADNGSGIPSELLPKVFEPFFTTKDTGKGSGLGLSMVYGFVSQSNGHVRITSDVDRGTRVRLYLPRAQHDGAHADWTTASTGSAAGVLPRASGGESVLLIEDNEDVRRFGAAALESLGYRVLQVSDGHAALQMLDQAGPHVDIVFTDVVLPGGLSGPDLVRMIRLRRPGIPALYTSGYMPSKVTPQGEGRLLAKPYPIESLASAIRQALDERAAR